MNTRCLLSLAMLAGCDLRASGTCETQAATWGIPVGAEARVAARSRPDGSIVMAATQALTVDGTTVPVATLIRINASGSIATIGSGLPDVPLDFSLTDTGAGVTLIENVITFSETLQVVWSGEVATGVGASVNGHIAYLTTSGLDPGVIHVRTLDGSALWTTSLTRDVYIYAPQIHLTTGDEVSLIDGTRYVFNSSGFVGQTGLSFRYARLQHEGSLLGVGNENETAVVRGELDGTVLWSTKIRSVVTSAVLASNGDVLAVREPGNVVRLDAAGRELATHENCADGEAPYGLGLIYADADGYVLHDARGIARYEGP